MSIIAQAIADRQSDIDRLQAEIKALTDVEQILETSATASRSTSRRSSSMPRRMSTRHEIYEVRCPVYGFITINDWEREIISQPEFQRLRRIRQLAWTDYVFPGAMHTRFEHSLGVTHMATMLYDGITQRSTDILKHDLGYNEDGLQRHRALVRLAALLHDVGHAPFSHAAEEVFPIEEETGDRYRHETYSAAVVRRYFADVIKNHPLNRNYDFSANDVACFLEGAEDAGPALFWKDLIDGQLDADRMDYLIRDSLHTGVGYGRYDWQRLIGTITAVGATEQSEPGIGVMEGGWHAAEGLIIARYFMFTQVYFHKTRVILDYHLQETLRQLLEGACFPSPRGEDLAKYLSWNDWRVLGLLADGQGGEHGRRLADRDHYREIDHTSETPQVDDLERLEQWRELLGDRVATEIRAEKSWYKLGNDDIPVVSETAGGIMPLSSYSSVVKSIRAVRQVRLYAATPEQRDEARALLAGA